MVDPIWYLNQYPDVKAANLDPKDHFRNYGRFEGRLAEKPQWLKSAESWLPRQAPKQIKISSNLKIVRPGLYQEEIKILKKLNKALNKNKSLTISQTKKFSIKTPVFVINSETAETALLACLNQKQKINLILNEETLERIRNPLLKSLITLNLPKP